MIGKSAEERRGYFVEKVICLLSLLFCFAFVSSFFVGCGDKNSALITYREAKSITDTSNDKSYSYIPLDVEMYNVKKDKTFYTSDFHIILNGNDIVCKSFLRVENLGATMVNGEIVFKYSVVEMPQQIVPAYDGRELCLYFDKEIDGNIVVLYQGVQLEKDIG